jgi:L-iditol 2-dehydrogenase
MKACVFHEPGRIGVEEVPDPRPGPGEVLLKVVACAVCHSDIRVYQGLKKARPGVIPGHEIAGVVAEVGPDVEGVAVGQRLVVCPILACGRCHYCLRDRRNRCSARRTLGYDENGGLAEFVLLPRALVELGHLLPVPEGLPLERASLMEPAACTLNSLETCRLRPGGSLAIIGAGPMGLMHLLLARAVGVSRTLVSEPLAERLEYARRWGATATVDPSRQDVRRAALEISDGLGVDAAVLTAGRVEALTDALSLVRRQGYVNLFAGFPPGAAVSLDPNLIHYDELHLTGTQNATPEQYRRVLRLLKRLPQMDELITHRFPIEQASEAYETRVAARGLKSIVVFPGGDAG